MLNFIKKHTGIFIFIGLIVSFISLNIILKFTVDDAFLDMTSTKRNSLSQVSIEQAQQLSQPVYVTIYYSSDIAAENPVVAKYAEFVMQFLKQYQHTNPDKIFITVKNPIPYSEAETEARKAGITAFKSNNGESNLYFGAVFKDSNGKILTIPNFSWERDFWLEKDITNILVQINQPQKKVIGLISPVHKMIKREFITGINRYAIIQEMMERYNILELAPNLKEIPLSVDLVLIVEPRKMPLTTIYALEQYVLAGGKVIMLLDLLSEQTDHQMTYETLAEINSLLAPWGVEGSNTLVGSRYYGQKIFLRFGKDDTRQTSYPLWLNLTPEAINQTEPIMKDLSDIRLRTALEIKEKDHAEEISVTPLLKINKGAIYHKEEVDMGKNYIVSGYENDNMPHTLAAIIRGKFQSKFAQAPDFAADNKRPFLYYSVQPSEIIVIGDSDFITDDIWLEDDNLSDNGQFLLKAVDYMLGQPELASLYKSQHKIYQESLGGQLYNTLTSRHAEAISRLQSELQNLKMDYDILHKNVEKGIQNLDAITSKQLNETESKIKDIQTRLQYYNYSIKQAYKIQTQAIVFINMLIIPLVEVLVLFLSYGWYQRRCRRKIKEKFNAR